MNQFLKRIYLTFAFMVCVLFSYGQGVIDQIGGSIANGNVAGISRHFDNAVTLSVAGSQATYSRSQAEMILKEFFSRNEVKGFTIEHSSTSSSNSYAIGTLVTSQGNYRAYFTVRQKDNRYYIQEIRFER